MSGLYMDSQAPYSDSEAVPETTKSFASSLHKGTTFDQINSYRYNSCTGSQHTVQESPSSCTKRHEALRSVVPGKYRWERYISIAYCLH